MTGKSGQVTKIGVLIMREIPLMGNFKEELDIVQIKNAKRR